MGAYVDAAIRVYIHVFFIYIGKIIIHYGNGGQ